MWPRFEFRRWLLMYVEVVVCSCRRCKASPPPDTSQFPAFSFKATVQCGVYEPLQTIS